jgi:hypothetical protein
MCEPTTITALVGGALSIASGISQYQDSKAAANAQNDYNKQAARDAADNARQQYNDVQRRKVQEDIAKGQQLQQSKLELQKRQAEAKAAASDAGMSGFSLDSILADMAGQSARAQDSIGQQGEWTQQQLTSQMQGIQSGGQRAVNSLSPVRIPGIGDLASNIAGGASQVGGALFSDYTSYKGGNENTLFGKIQARRAQSPDNSGIKSTL